MPYCPKVCVTGHIAGGLTEAALCICHDAAAVGQDSTYLQCACPTGRLRGEQMQSPAAYLPNALPDSRSLGALYTQRHTGCGSSHWGTGHGNAGNIAGHRWFWSLKKKDHQWAASRWRRWLMLWGRGGILACSGKKQMGGRVDFQASWRSHSAKLSMIPASLLVYFSYHLFQTT